MSEDSKAVPGAIDNMFVTNNNMLTQHIQSVFKSGKTKNSKKELELALTVLLVDLACCDQHFDQQEYHVITRGLKRVFGTQGAEVSNLINEALETLQQLRGTGRFATLLKDQLSVEDKRAIMEVIEEVIAADGTEDGFETYLRHKFAGLLGISIQ